MARYLVTTKSETYNGKTLGIKFQDGKAVVDEYTVPKNLGRKPDEVARLMKRDFGLEVQKIVGEQIVEEIEETAPEEAAPPPPKKGGRPKAVRRLTELKTPPATGE